jgi:glycosyltransferase involved in cell wall biosynthesis
MHYPKIIIVGETFRLNGGGGITLTNLFKDWPGENIGVVTDLIEHTNPLTDYSYYQLGSEEIRFPFPFHPFQKYFKSGPYKFETEDEKNNSPELKQSSFSRFKKWIRPHFDNFLNRLGLYTFFYKIRLSESLKNWIMEFNPDIVYIQPFHQNMMRFGNLICQELEIPYAIHIMDDSVNYINKSIILKKRLQRLIEDDFKRLVNNAKVHMCISDAMAEEYYLRYGKVFLPFRNPIETAHWLSGQKGSGLHDPERLRIIYTGRIFEPTEDALLDVCKVIDELNRENNSISLQYTLDNTPAFLKKIENLQGISYHPPVSSSELPGLIQQYDLYLLCINFDQEAKTYFQFSMSTRASEGMVSGVPVLVYAPDTLALSRYFTKTDSGCVIGERDTRQLKEAIVKLWKDSGYRERISKNAVRTALHDSDSVVVREEFRKALIIGENGKEL